MFMVARLPEDNERSSHRLLICMVTYFPDPSDLPPLLNTARSLIGAGYAVEVLCHTGRADLPRRERYTGNLEVVRIYSRTRGFFSRVYGLSPRTTLIAFAQYLLTYAEYNVRVFLNALRAKADLYEAHDLPTLPATLLAARIRQRPVLYRAHELHAETHRRVRFARFWRLLERILVPLVDCVVTPEENRSQILHHEAGARRPPLTVMNCPPYRAPLRSDRLREMLRGRQLFPRFILLYQGLFAEDRCIAELIASAAHFADGIVLVLMGHGYGTYADLTPMISDPLRVVTLPRVPYDELLHYTASADAGVLLYRNTCRNNYYCAPNKIHEYMMMGLPVVTNDYPGMKAFVEGEHVGVSVNCEDPLQIAEAVNLLARPDGPYRTFRTNALKVAAEKYNWEQQFRAVEPVYRRLLTNKAPREMMRS